MTDDGLDRSYAWLDGGDRLTAFELRVVRDAVAGAVTAAVPDTGGAPLSVRAEVLLRLCLGFDEGWRLTALGLRLNGARVAGALDLAGLCGSGGGRLAALDLADCVFDAPIGLAAARMEAVRLDRASFPSLAGAGIDLARGLSAKDAVCGGDIMLDNCVAGGGVVLEGLRPPPGAWGAGPRVSLVGAVLAGNLDLTRAVLARGAEGKAVALDLNTAQIRHIDLDGARLTGGVSAIALKVQVQWSANRVLFDNPDGLALLLDAADIGGLFLIGASVRGAAQACGALVRGVVNAQGATFVNPTGAALNLSGSRIDGGLQLTDYWGVGAWEVGRGARIVGQLDLNQTRIGGDLSLDGAEIIAPTDGGPAGVAIDARELEVGGTMWWTVSPSNRRPRVAGMANFAGARLHGDADLRGLLASHLVPGLTPNPDPRGTLTRFRLRGAAISLAGAEVGGRLLFGLAPIEAATAPSLETPPPAPPPPPAGEDETRDGLGRAWIERLEGPAVGVVTDIVGRLNLARAHLARGVRFEGARLTPGRAESGDSPADLAAATAVSLQGAVIGTTLFVRPPGDPPPLGGIIDLRTASCEELDDGSAGVGWGGRPGVDPAGHAVGHRLELSGFTYSRLRDDGPTARWMTYAPAWLLRRWVGRVADRPLWARREDWLRRQHRGARPTAAHYAPQPWGQLAATLRAAGRDDDARSLTIAHYNFRLEAGVEPLPTALRSWAVRLLFGYGYSPALAFAWFLLFITLGGAGVGYAARQDGRAGAAPASCAAVGPWNSSRACPFLITPAAEGKAGPVSVCARRIEPILYALDVFLPVVNLKEQDRCEVNPARPGWRWIKALYALVGWVFVPLAALTFAGVLKRG